MNVFAMFDVRSKRVIDLVRPAPKGDPEKSTSKQKSRQASIYKKELEGLYHDLTGQDLDAKDLDTAKEAVVRVLDDQLTHPNRGPRKAPVDGPVAVARRIFQEMEGKPRREIIEACAKAGVKRSTAATQYQRWKGRTIDQPAPKETS